MTLPLMPKMMTQMGSATAGLMVAYAMFQNYFPYQLRSLIKRYTRKLFDLFYPYIQVTFPEYQGDGFQRSSAFAAIQRYLNANSTKQAKRFKASFVHDSEAVVVLTMAEHEEVTDEFEGIKLWWASSQTIPNKQSISLYPREDEKRYFRLTFHKKYRDVITERYLKHVITQGKEITLKERRRRLYTNNKTDGGGWFSRRRMWSDVVFKHPATFDTLAMNPDKKKEIIDDLLNFSNSKDYYKKIGKAWKRGYLLFGPPGTGKSTMIAAMANLLKYDVYDLELTSVKDNTELRKLLIDTSGKSIIVIEDIDCSLDLTGQREKKKKEEDGKKKKKDAESKDDPAKKMKKEMEEKKTSEVTLSGLLNFIDGLWSACGSERIIVFTTNYVEKLDPALIRRGRMDKHIELSYCSYEAFKVLAKNYLDIDDDSQDSFATIRRLLEETNMTPADVAENLMPKFAGEDKDSCLARLIKSLEEANEQARKKAEEEEKKKAEKVAKEEEEKNKENGVKCNGVKENGEELKVETEDVVKENGEKIKVKGENEVKENGVAAKVN